MTSTIGGGGMENCGGTRLTETNKLLLIPVVNELIQQYWGN